MNIPSEIARLWQQHATAVFPDGYAGRQINGLDLPLLEAEIAGLIRIYMHTGMKLDTRQVKNLRERLIDLNTIILLMEHEELTYFDRLRTLANLVLQEIEK